MTDITETKIYRKASVESQVFLKDSRTLENAWNTCHRSDWMLWGLKKASYSDDKTLRLFAVWYIRETPLLDGRKIWDLLTERIRNAVEVAEHYANGEANKEELKAAWEAAWKSAWSSALESACGSAQESAWLAACESARESAWSAAFLIALSYPCEFAWPSQADQLRKMIANPFCGNKIKPMESRTPHGCVD